METLPIDDRFDPTKLELVMHFLRNKVRKGQSNFITDMNVYEDDLWLLKHVTPHPQFMEREWFYFVPTTQRDNTKLKRIVPGRNRESVGGTWRSIDRDRKSIKYNETVVGYKESFVYYKKVKRNPKEKRTDWYMKEFSLRDDELQDWVLCKIQHRTSEKIVNYMKDLNKKKNYMKDEQKEKSGLADEFVEMVLGEDSDVTRQQQETHVLPPQAKDSGFETTQSNDTKWWDDVIYEQLQKLPEILQLKIHKNS